MQTISDYISQVRLQQAINPLFPKQDNDLSDFYLPYTQAESIQYLINKPFNYLSTRYIKGFYYWEFVNSNNITDFVDLEFLYILVDPTIFQSIKTYLPYYSTWNEAKQLELVYPKLSYLLDANSVSYGSSYFVNVSSGFSHPFIPTLEFTGFVCLLKQTLLYEYQDITGYYAQKDYQYLSPLRPLNLDYPLGIPTDSQLTVDDCYLDEYDKYPSSGDSNWVGEYQGQYTNSTYNKHIKFYLYGNSTENFLLQQPPKTNYKGIALEALSLVGIEPIVKLPTLTQRESITISQQSTLLPLILS